MCLLCVQTPESSSFTPRNLVPTASVLDILSSVYGPQPDDAAERDMSLSAAEEHVRTLHDASSTAPSRHLQAISTATDSVSAASSSVNHHAANAVGSQQSHLHHDASSAIVADQSDNSSQPDSASKGGAPEQATSAAQLSTSLGETAAEAGPVTTSDHQRASEQSPGTSLLTPAAQHYHDVQVSLEAAAAHSADLASNKTMDDLSAADTPAGLAGPLDMQDSRASLARMDSMLEARTRLQEELSEYITDLKQKTDVDGEQLIDIPGNYLVLVEQMLQERRSQFKALQGWGGPHR